MQYSHWRHSDMTGRRHNTVATATTLWEWQQRSLIRFPTGAKYLYSLKRPYRRRGPPSHRVNECRRSILLREHSCWDMNRTTHVHLVRSLRKSGVISPLAHVPSRRDHKNTSDQNLFTWTLFTPLASLYAFQDLGFGCLIQWLRCQL
jgi:hypothetical protein